MPSSVPSMRSGEPPRPGRGRSTAALVVDGHTVGQAHIAEVEEPSTIADSPGRNVQVEHVDDHDAGVGEVQPTRRFVEGRPVRVVRPSTTHVTWSASTRYNAAFRGRLSRAIVPTQTRPRPSTLASLARFSGLSCRSERRPRLIRWFGRGPRGRREPLPAAGRWYRVPPRPVDPASSRTR